MSTNETNLETVIAVAFVSKWDMGTEIESQASLDTATGRVFDIVGTDADDVETLDGEYIRLADHIEDIEVELTGREEDYFVVDKAFLAARLEELEAGKAAKP